MTRPQRGGRCATCGASGLAQGSTAVLVCVNCGSTYAVGGRFADLITRADARPLLGPDQQPEQDTG